jgi:hypothetical protein
MGERPAPLAGRSRGHRIGPPCWSTAIGAGRERLVAWLLPIFNRGTMTQITAYDGWTMLAVMGHCQPASTGEPE